MTKCLSCYQPLAANDTDYHAKCAQLFFGHKQAPILPYRLSEIEQLAKEAAKLSITITGVQPKLSVGSVKDILGNGPIERLTILDALEGKYILKPQNNVYLKMPENEHLSMKLATLFKINVVPMIMIRLASGELCYLTKRIDRNIDGSKNHMIDFLQILELSNKYMGTMELLGKTIGSLSANTLLDKYRFFEVTVFNHVIGNNDMHLKNFSMLHTNMGWVLSPFYDLLNVKLVLPKDKEDIALMIGGKKENFSRKYFDQLGLGLQLNQKQILGVYKRLEKWLPNAVEIIDQSFLGEQQKQEYIQLISQRTYFFSV